MALSSLAKNIKRLHELSDQAKAIEAERDSLKKYFRDQAAGADAVFEYGAREVTVGAEERTAWDNDALTAHFGEKAAEFKKTSSTTVVRCRTKKKEKAA